MSALQAIAEAHCIASSKSLNFNSNAVNKSLFATLAIIKKPHNSPINFLLRSLLIPLEVR